MAQSSGPIAQGTTAERQFTDVLWRARFGDKSGVLGDYDGSSYAITLPGSGDIISVGSATQDSLATVGGFSHKIPSGSPEPLTIPAASGSTRTDIVALRYDPAFTGALGPVRLVRIAGTTAAVPSYDAGPPGIEELPLFSITRAVSQALSAATVTRMFPRIGPALELPTGAVLPSVSPLGSMLRQGSTTYRRQLNPTLPAWVAETHRPRVIKRDHTPVSSFIPSGAFRESGVADAPTIAPFTVPEASYIFMVGHFRCGGAGGVALPSMKINGSTVADGVGRGADESKTLVAGQAVTSGTVTIGMRVDALGGDASWTSGKLLVIVGAVE